MLQGLINDAKSAAASVAAKYAARASVALPFLIALASATLAVTLMLSERFGAINALWIVAGGFTTIGAIATFVVATTEKAQDTLADEAAATPAGATSTPEAADAAMTQAPLALLGDLLTSIGGPATALSAGRLVGRNLPLVLLAGLVGLLLLPSRAESNASDMGSAETDGLNGAEGGLPREPYDVKS